MTVKRLYLFLLVSVQYKPLFGDLHARNKGVSRELFNNFETPGSGRSKNEFVNRILIFFGGTGI